MNVKTTLLLGFASLLLFTSASAFAQNFEITGHVGAQLNGGLDLSTTQFERIEVGNSTNYGVSLGYLLGDYYGLEFEWNHTQADTKAEPLFGGPDIDIFSLNHNQYMGNFLFHLTDREAKLRPFAFVGLGASDLSPDRDNVDGTTQFAFALGGGAKYNVSKHFGLRGQLKWSPTYIATTDEGYWCDPFWGGCWSVGENHYLHEMDVTVGVTLRF
jgi:opacity protein-like surface antigen